MADSSGQSPEPAANTFRAGFNLLRNANVAKLFFAYLVSYSGSAMAPIAMAFGVLELTGSTKDSAIVIAAPTIASIVVLLFGGVLADRTSRKFIMVGSELLAMLAQVAMAYLFISGQATVPLLTALMLVNGVVLALHMPAAMGLIVQLVDKEQLQSTNALLSTARNGALVIGAAMGGLLVAWVGPGLTLLIDAASFGLSAMVIFTLAPRAQSRPEAASILTDLKIGWREFTSHTWLWSIVLQFSLIVAVFESIFGLLGPAIARTHFDGAADWGIIASSLGAGTLCGGIVAMKIRPKYPMRFASFCVFFFTGVGFALAVPLKPPFVAILAFINGVAGQIFATIWYTTLHLKIPEHMLSRVSAYDHLGSIVLAPLGIVAAGFLYEEIGFRTTLLIAAGIIIFATLAVLCVRDVWTMTND